MTVPGTISLQGVDNATTPVKYQSSSVVINATPVRYQLSSDHCHYPTPTPLRHHYDRLSSPINSIMVYNHTPVLGLN